MVLPLAVQARARRRHGGEERSSWWRTRPPRWRCRRGGAKRMCNRTTRKLFLFLIVIVALILGIPNFLKVQARSGAVQAKCRLMSFHYPEDYVFPPDSSMPCPKDFGFQVMGFMGSRPFAIRDWEPKFDAATSLPSRGWGSHQEFSCCPLEPFDHCLFYQAGSFCDDFGKVVDGCPKAAWDCYIIDLEKHLAGTEGIPPGDLYVGKAAEGQLEFMAALAMLGFAVVCLVFPKTVSIVAHFIVKQSGERADLLFHQLPVLVAQALPPELHTKYLQEKLKKELAIRSVQKWWKRVYLQHCLRRLLEKSRKDKSDCLEEKRSIKFMKTGVEQERFAGLPPPCLPGTLPESLLYDTGDPNTFRRMVKARVASAPGEPRVTIEVALGASSELGAELQWRKGEASRTHPSPPYLAKIRRRGIAGMHGLQRGDELVKVGPHMWPRASCKQLADAFFNMPKPLFLVFEGPERNGEVFSRSPALAPGARAPREAARLQQPIAMAAAEAATSRRKAAQAPAGRLPSLQVGEPLVGIGGTAAAPQAPESRPPMLWDLDSPVSRDVCKRSRSSRLSTRSLRTAADVQGLSEGEGTLSPTSPWSRLESQLDDGVDGGRFTTPAPTSPSRSQHGLHR